MRLVENFDPVTPLKNRTTIASFIDKSLLGDWILRIEYSGRNAWGQTDWLQWDSTFFAISSPDNVMRAIDSCYAYFPERDIRIYAEKVRPETRMVYSVNRVTRCGVNLPVTVDVEPEAENQNWPQAVNTVDQESIAAKNNSAWQYLAAVGTLAGTLLVWEAASS